MKAWNKVYVRSTMQCSKHTALHVLQLYSMWPIGILHAMSKGFARLGYRL